MASRIGSVARRKCWSAASALLKRSAIVSLIDGPRRRCRIVA
jgi:hypothetical protein